MRLINTETLQVEFFMPSRIPPDDANDEVSFQEFNDLDKAKTKRGFPKIEETCKLARKNDIKYAWVDTCCIDKSSSAELSESLNSMYNWYQKSHVCYAYINDWQSDSNWVDLAALEQDEGSTDQGDDSRNQEDDFDEEDWGSSEEGYSEVEDEDHYFTSTTWQKDERSPPPNNSMGQGASASAAVDRDTHLQSSFSGNDQTSQKAPLRWFTRGWTLQELIAPCEVEFYDANWVLRGAKQDSVVAEHISRITVVPAEVLRKGGKRALQGICLGQRMSWAAYRVTSREEDIAYCLLGIFQVNMPTLYGEGENAFFRLQEEILRYSTDLSIFAWTEHHREQNRQSYRGILSRHPREFYRLKDCRLLETQFKRNEEVVMTNRGLRFDISLLDLVFAGRSFDLQDVVFMDLGCLINDKPQGICLEKISEAYVRVFADRRIRLSDLFRRARSCTIYIARDVDRDTEHRYNMDVAFGVKIHLETQDDSDSHFLEMIDAWPLGFFNQKRSTFLASGLGPFTGFTKIAITDREFPFDERKRIAAFILVVVFNRNGFLAYILDGEDATRFENFAKSTLDMNHITANINLRKYRHATSKQFKSEITVNDRSTKTLFRVSLKRRTKK